MLIRNIKEFLEKTKTRKILALDMGKKKIGLAISDPNHKIVNPLEVLKKDKNYLDNLLFISLLNSYIFGSSIFLSKFKITYSLFLLRTLDSNSSESSL